jgi:hypothetical protein
MSRVVEFPDGGYRYIEGVFQYSAGVASEPGFVIERVQLSHSLPLAEGFEVLEDYLHAIERPMTSLCACELRSPEPFSEEGFVEFNHTYVEALARWGLYRGGINPVARTNVCPEYDKPDVPSLFAFSYTVPADGNAGSFIIAGSGEAKEGLGHYRDNLIRPGDTSEDGLREKIRFVMGEMTNRLEALGFGWRDAVYPQVYTVHEVDSLVEAEFVVRGASSTECLWHVCRPPVVGIEFEMDVIGPAKWVELNVG